MKLGDVAGYYRDSFFAKLVSIELEYLVFVAFALVVSEIFFLKSISNASFLVYGILAGVYARKQREDARKKRAILGVTLVAAATATAVTVSLFLMTLVLETAGNIWVMWASEIILDAAFLAVGALVSTKIKLGGEWGQTGEARPAQSGWGRRVTAKTIIVLFIAGKITQYAGETLASNAIRLILTILATAYLVSHILKKN